MARVLTAAPPKLLPHWPELRRTAEPFVKEWGAQGFAVHPVEVERLLVDPNATTIVDARRLAALEPAREALFGSEPPLAVEARQRYRWVNETLAAVESPGSRIATRGAQVVDWLNQPWPATIMFVLAMAVVFQAVFAWAKPFMDLIDAGASGLGRWVGALLPPGAVSSFVVDGAIAGVGSVVVFLPQILILFLFIILMEDTGYLARAAFLVDRAMRAVGLVGPVRDPALVELRVRGAVDHGDARDPESPRPNCDDPRGAVHDVLGALAGLRAT